MNRRRTTRHFSAEAVPRRLIELALLTAGTAPSGAHRQPWRFVAIDDADLKRQLRTAAEEEKLKTYRERLTDEWREALHPLGTDHVKEHMTDAPWIVVLFAEKYGLRADGTQRKNYYVDESVGIAAGLFIAAIQTMGLVTLTHTPNPMGFLREVLGRGTNEKAVLVLPVGYPAAGAQVPDWRGWRRLFSGMCETNPIARQSSGPQATRSESPGRIKIYIGKDTEGDAQTTGIELRVVVKLTEAKKGFVLLPRRWLVERSFGWLARFRRQSRDFERRPHVPVALHFLIFVTLVLPKAVGSGRQFKVHNAL